MNHEEIEALDHARETAPQKRESQIRLAEELTRLIHGEAGLIKAQRAKDVLFGAEIENLTDQDLGQIFPDVPSKDLEMSLLEGDGLPVVDAFVLSGLAKSKGEARRTVQQGGAYINNRRITNVDERLTKANLASETTIVLRSGKKKFALLRFK